MRRRPLAALLAAAVLVAGCAGGSGSVRLRDERTGTIAWTPCDRIECASLGVPLDPGRPSGPKITLALARLPARRHAEGVLFTNPGGPGGSGVDFLRTDAGGVFPTEIRDRFDLVSWDPRGVGASAPVTCQRELDAFYAVDRTPESQAGLDRNVAVARAFVAACEKNSGDLLPYLSTEATARDLDAIRAAMGLQQISYVGFSYGTLLGALYAARYPERVRAMVLDGAVDPARTYVQSTVDQAKSFDDDLRAFFVHCRGSDTCPFAGGGDPSAAYEDLVHTVRAEPVPGTVAGEHRMLGPGELDIGVASALYVGAGGYDRLASALAKLAGGDAAPMLVLADAYTGRKPGGTYSNATAALYATGCLDAPAPSTVRAVDDLAALAAKAAPHFGASTVWLGLPCTFWPVPPQGKAAPIDAAGAPPIVVIGTTHDPATPYAWARALASQLDSGRLLTAEGTAHMSYGRGDACVDGNVDRYLLDLTVPAAGTTCG
jgi:pimeloyl-ACP methyl ester carboxylesterase